MNFSYLFSIRVMGVTALCFAGIHSYSQCAPDVTPPNIICPSDISVSNDAGLCGSVVSFGALVATDNCTVTQTDTYSYTGSVQTWTVPAGITTITIECWGAQGQGGNGGLGGYAKGDLSVTPGQTINIYVGGQNGFNGGGLGYAAVPKNGGDASDVRLTGTALTDRVIVAGGGGAGGPADVGNYQGGHGGGGNSGPNYAGGGAGQGYGGAGGIGGATGGTGNTSCHAGGAGGGGFTSGGDGSCNTCYTSTCGQDGSFGLGGNGDTWETGICYSSYGGTAGGGGGYYGGGGTSVGNCGTGAGGGGSSWTGTLTNTSFMGGVKSGNGEIKISYSSPVTVTQLAGLPDGSLFPIGITTQTFEAEDGAGNTASCSFEITVIDGEAPVADNGSLADFEGCNEASPVAPTATDNCAGAITGTPDVTFPISTIGTTTVTWTYDDGDGNTSTQTQDVIVSSLDVTTSLAVMTITANFVGASSYQWIDCNDNNAPISGETNQSFTASADGSYAVIISNGTCSDTSSCVTINTSGISDNVLSPVKIYPNPTSGNYVIELDQIYLSVQVRISDPSGRIVEEFSSSATNKITGNFNGAKGIYVVQIIADGKQFVSDLIIE